MADPTLSGLVQNNSVIYLTIGTVVVAYLAGSVMYDVFLGPLSKFPGPKLYAASKLPGILDEILGRNGVVMPAMHEKYGPFVRVAPRQLSFVGDSQTWNDLYGHKKAGQQKPFKDPLVYTRDHNGAHSVVTAANDADHARMRKILTHAFSDRALREQEPILKQWVLKLICKLSERTGDDIDILKFYNCTTFDIMGDLTFGENLNMLDHGELSSWVQTIYGSIKIGTIVGVITKIHPVFKWFVANVLMNTNSIKRQGEEHRAYSVDRLNRRLERGETDRPDFWSKILAKEEGKEGLTLHEHQANAEIFMIAGTETTATALSGTTYHLLRNPQVLQKLTTEIRNTFSSFDELTLERLAQMKYLQAVLQEGLRMYPPVPIAMTRRTPDPGCKINGEWVPGGVAVGIHNLATFSSSSNFSDAKEFRPERWIEHFEGDKLDSLEPFSFGPRNCIGKNLAWHEMRLILAAVLLHFDLKLCPESAAWSNQKIYTLWEKVPLMCVLSSVRRE